MNGDQNPQTPLAGLPTHPKHDPNHDPGDSKSAAADAEPVVDDKPEEEGFFHSESPEEQSPSEPEVSEEPEITEETPHRIKVGSVNPIEWTSEGLQHSAKSNGQRALIILILAVLCAGIWYVTGSVFTGMAIFVAGALFIYHSSRQPHAVTYKIDSSGITIGQKHFTFAQFRSFAVIDEGSFTSVGLMPLKRFAPMTSLTYDPKMEETVVGTLSNYLPVEEHKRDLIDEITALMRF